MEDVDSLFTALADGQSPTLQNPVLSPDSWSKPDSLFGSRQGRRIAGCLESQCSVNMQDAGLDHLEMVTNYIQELMDTPPEAAEPFLDHVTTSEVTTLLGTLRMRKASGLDFISNKILKNGPTLSTSLS